MGLGHWIEQSHCMNKLLIISFLFSLLLSGCSSPEAETDDAIMLETVVVKPFQQPTFEYDSLTIPEFLKQLVFNHTDGYILHDTSFKDICLYHFIDSKDSANQQIYYSFEILHDLFTSQSCFDCSTGEILKIPYYWHWIAPNPRHEIYFEETGVLLSETAPPKEFGKYNSYADIDRTPYLFLSDMFSDTAKYYSKCGPFKSFGWCSEREMAFVCLNRLYGYEGKVVTSGAHSWSEFVVEMKSADGNMLKVHITVDNTFDNTDWKTISDAEYAKWKTELGEHRLSKWYNEMSRSEKESERVKNHIISNKVMTEVDAKLTTFITERVNNALEYEKQ